MQKTVRNHANLAVSLKELTALGSPVDLSVADSGDRQVGVEIEQVGGVYDSRIFQLRGGLTAYILDLAITNQTQKTIYCDDIELSLPWQDDFFHWLQDPREEDGSSVYRFPRRNALEFPRHKVLNHLLLENGVLMPRRPVRGRLLGIGRPLPGTQRHGQRVEVRLRIFASDHTEHTANLRLWTERPEIKRNARVGKGNLFEPERPGVGLYGKGKNSLAGAAVLVSQKQENDKMKSSRPEVETFNFEKLREAANSEMAAKDSAK
jgi:hypothetical protein